MIANPLVRKVVQVEYAIVRTPLALVDRQLAARAGGRSKAAVVVERGLQSLDAIATRLIAEPRPPSAKQYAPTRPAPAADEGSPEVSVDEVEHVAEDLLADQAEHELVGELADPELQEVQAKLRAKHLLEEREEQKRRRRPAAKRTSG